MKITSEAKKILGTTRYKVRGAASAVAGAVTSRRRKVRQRVFKGLMKRNRKSFSKIPLSEAKVDKGFKYLSSRPAYRAQKTLKYGRRALTGLAIFGGIQLVRKGREKLKVNRNSQGNPYTGI